jgi:CotH kinase protein
VLALLAAPAALLGACGDDVVNQYYENNYYVDGGADGVDDGASAGQSAGGVAGASGGQAPTGPGGEGGAGGGAGGGGGDPYPDAPAADTSVADHELDIFGTWGNRYWFAVSEEQLALMNQSDNGGFEDGLYQPGGGGRANWVDHLFITTAGENPQTADYGKVQAKIVGQYSRFPWTDRTIPNLNIDADEFIDDQRIATYEHLRFSNGQRGSIFRDKLAYDLYRMLDYPAPLATYAWVQSNVWGPQVSIPYTLVERYKRVFCDRYAEQFGGGCANMWEFVGDFGGGDFIPGPRPLPIDAIPGPIEPGGASLFDDPENCQIGKCDSTRVRDLEALLRITPAGPGFKEALSEYIDWPSFHRFQCLSWVLSTTDDTIHAGNNVVLVERADGLFQYLPYSVDISMGFGGGGYSGLSGQSALAVGCQGDEACWADTLDMCEDVIDDLTKLEPREYLKSLYDDLDASGMLRPGDEANFRGVDSYFAERLANLPGDLEQYRLGNVCEYPNMECNGKCVPQWECVDPCFPGEPVLLAAEPAGDGAGGATGVGGATGAGGATGVGGGDPIECPAVVNYAVVR